MPRILVADDNSNIQKMVALAFEEHGIDVIAVGNGEAAVRRLPDVLPDVVLADVFMPVRNGYEVCEYVKKDKRFAHTPVILLVGAFDPLDEVEARRVGADGVLKKPFVPPDPLISMVMGILAKLPKPEPKAEPAPAVVEPPRVVPAPQTAPVSVSSDASPEEEVYAFGTGRRSLDDDGPAELAAATQKVAVQPTAHAKVVTAIEAPASATEEEDTSFSETHADWRRRDEVDSASVPDFSAELCPDPAPAVVEEPPAPPPVPEREVGPIEFLDATDTGQTLAELDAPPEPERPAVAVEFFEPPADSGTWTPSSIHDRAITAPASDVLVVEPETFVDAESTAPVPVASATSTVEAAPKRNDAAATEHRTVELAAQRYESDSQRYNAAASDRPNASFVDLVAPALAQPTEWSAPREVASASTAAAEAISEVGAELHSASQAEAPATSDVASAEHSIAAHEAPETHVATADEVGPEASASVATPAPAGYEAAASSAARFDEAADARAAAAIRAPEEFRAAAEEESAILAEAEAVANWEAASDARVEPESAHAPTAAESIGAAEVHAPALADASDVAETRHAAKAEAEPESTHASGTDAATIAANAVLASLAGGEALLPNRAATEVSASHAATASPSAAQLPQPSVDEVVAKVLERLGPQLQEILANGLVRPLVEGLLAQQRPPERKE